MGKEILIAGALAASATTAAITYYVSPAAPSDLNVPPVKTALSQDQVMQKLGQLSGEGFVSHISYLYSGKKIHLTQIKFDRRYVGSNSLHFYAKAGDDALIKVALTANNLSESGSEIDVVAKILDSRFSKSTALHPYDIKALESWTDLLITEYVNSIVDEARMASSSEFEREFNRRVGFSRRQMGGFSNRIERALRDSYGRQLTGYELRAESTASENDFDSEYVGSISGNPVEWSDAESGGTAPARGYEDSADDWADFGRDSSRAAADGQKAAQSAAAAAAEASRAAIRAAEAAR